MKMIKQILLGTVLICSAALVQAQKITNKPAGNPRPQETLPPVKAPEMKNAPKPVTNAESVTETPSPLTRDKNQQPEEKAKPKLVLVDDKEAATPGGEEGRKIMAGKATRPTPEVNNHSTIDPKPAPQPVKSAKPVNGQQQQ
jgi:hypothetical protein